MQSRFERLIHKHDGQRDRRFIPGAFMATAAIVAVALFLLIPSSTQASPPREEVGSALDCSGLATVSLTASSGDAVQQTSTATDCDYSISLGQLPSTHDNANPCVVTATPRSLGATGVGVLVSANGDCNGAEIRLTSNVGPSVQASSSGYAAAYAELIGQDAGDLVDMFGNKSQVSWGYTATTVNSASHYPSDWVWSSVVWSVTSRYSSLTKQGTTSYQGYNRVKFKAIQNTRADTKATLIAKPSGAFSCKFSIKWTNKPIGFNHDTECDVE
ncbi:MAG: hypothetical protein OXH40_02850 [Chloroflexi bacterium]|nr:hypothetical protein [Chloroflexota bacterium]MCY3685756.1 hypothetical protein [Chloroflexota bacterium]MDE2708023.1 hypothetical protein [Chloroflexota bacterium]